MCKNIIHTIDGQMIFLDVRWPLFSSPSRRKLNWNQIKLAPPGALSTQKSVHFSSCEIHEAPSLPQSFFLSWSGWDVVSFDTKSSFYSCPPLRDHPAQSWFQPLLAKCGSHLEKDFLAVWLNNGMSSWAKNPFSSFKDLKVWVALPHLYQAETRTLHPVLFP